METIDTKSNVNPSKSLLGNSFLKSFSWYRDMRMDRNMTMDVTEEHRAKSDEMAKMSKTGKFSRVGLPVTSLMPPGTVVAVAKATVAMRAPITEQDSEALVSHSLPSFTSPLWVSLKMSFGVLLSLLKRTKKCGGMEVFTICTYENQV